MDITRGVEHTLSTGEGLTRPLGLFATVKEVPTLGVVMHHMDCPRQTMKNQVI